MQVMKETPGQSALTIDESASVLGLHEFSLMSRIQAGEIKVARAKSGEMVIPESELERLAGGPVSAQSVEGGAILPDECLGIERRRGGLKQNGELVLPYKVSGCRFSEREINGYRAASSAIAGQLESIKDFKRQLTRSDQVPESCDFEINTPEIGRWEVRSALLNGSFEFLLNFRPEFGRNNRRENPAHAQSQIMQAAQNMMGKHPAGSEDGVKILRRCLNQSLVSDRVERFAFDRPLSAQPGAFFFHRTKLPHHKVPCAFNQLRVSAAQIGPGNGDVDGWLRGRVIFGANDSFGFFFVPRAEAFSLARLRIKTEEHIFPFAEPVFLFHRHLSA